MEVQQDFKELLALFNAHNVDYMIVGAYALAFHGAPRYTGDLDILVRADKENAKRILDALNDFGFGKVGLEEADFSKPDQIIQLGVPPVRIDIITSITGVTWEEAKQNREQGIFDDIPVYYIGRQQFISNKKALGRKKDMADIEALGIILQILLDIGNQAKFRLVMESHLIFHLSLKHRRDGIEK